MITSHRNAKVKITSLIEMLKLTFVTLLHLQCNVSDMIKFC